MNPNTSQLTDTDRKNRLLEAIEKGFRFDSEIWCQVGARLLSAEDVQKFIESGEGFRVEECGYVYYFVPRLEHTFVAEMFISKPHFVACQNVQNQSELDTFDRATLQKKHKKHRMGLFYRNPVEFESRSRFWAQNDEEAQFVLVNAGAEFLARTYVTASKRQLQVRTRRRCHVGIVRYSQICVPISREGGASNLCDAAGDKPSQIPSPVTC